MPKEDEEQQQINSDVTNEQRGLLEAERGEQDKDGDGDVGYGAVETAEQRRAR